MPQPRKRRPNLETKEITLSKTTLVSDCLCDIAGICKCPELTSDEAIRNRRIASQDAIEVILRKPVVK